MENQKRRGRPRKYTNDAERKRAYRKRQKANRPLGTVGSLIPPPRGTDDPEVWAKYMAATSPMNAGLFLEDAPSGRGELRTGETGAIDLDDLDALGVEREIFGGRRVNPKGGPPDSDDD